MAHDVENQLQLLRQQAIKFVAESEGLRIGDIASLLGVSVDMAKLVVRPLVGNELVIMGATRAARYFPAEVGEQ